MEARRFISEGPIRYGEYRFGYCLWMELLNPQAAGEAYSSGFLPFSAEPGDPRHLYYMARSVRIDLQQFSVGKKRRYDHRYWQSFGLDRQLLPKETFLEEFGQVAYSQAALWMQNRFGEAYLKPERMNYIFGKPHLKDVLIWTRSRQLEAFALIVRGDWGAHYWYVFYNTSEAAESAPGHGYLVDFLDWAKTERLPYAYLGTGYGRKSRYKSRGLSPVQFWDGNSWATDKERLNQLQESDDLSVSQS